MLNTLLNIFLIDSIVMVVIYIAIVIDTKRAFPPLYDKVGGINILNPSRQVDILSFLICRKYATNKKIHIYDSFILNLIILLFLFVAIMLV